MPIPPGEPDHVTFLFGTRELEVRRPDLGNIDELSFQRVNHRSRGGDIIIFRDPDWPKTEVQNLNFTFPTEADAEEFKNFVRETAGELLQYTDHENRVWSGVIQNPDAELVQGGRSAWTINILFEGDQV